MSFDVFLSHAWVDQSPESLRENPRRGLVGVLRDRLEQAGLRVFYDERDIVAFDDIEQRIREGVSSSTLFVCWYSTRYSSRRACTWELTAAHITDPRRIAVVNPEPGIEHVLPESLRSGRAAAVPDADDAPGWQSLVDLLTDRVAAFGGVFGDVASVDRRTWYGDPPLRLSRFVGRSAPLWQVDSLLRPPPPAAGGRAAPQAVVLRGLGGVGKTALACEYATRFAGAYRGGVVWLRVGVPPDGLDAALHVQLALGAGLAQIARQVEPSAASGDQAQEQPELPAAQLLARYFAGAEPYLWVVDDVPESLSAEDFARCLPPSSNGVALLTTRGATYRHVPNVELPVLPHDEGTQLLLQDAPDLPASELTAAGDLAARLGHLPIALEVVGGLTGLPGVSPSQLLAELSADDTGLGVVEEAAQNPMVSVSATEHTPSMTMTFGPSLRRLDEPSFLLLAAASAINLAPLPLRVLRVVAQAVVGLDERGLRTAVGTLLSRSLARSVDQDTLEIHGLLAGSVLVHVADRTALRLGATRAAALAVAQELGDVEDLRTHARNRRIADFGLALALSSGQAHVDADALRLLGRFLHIELRFDEAIEVERQAVARARAEAGEGSREALVAEVNLSISLDRRSPDEARRRLTACAGALEQRFGPTDIDTLTAKHNLANMLAPSDAERSRQLALETYEARRESLGIDHPHTLFSLHSLLADGVLPPPYTDALEAYRDLVARRTRLLGEDDATTLTSTSNFVVRLLSVGQPGAALPLARRLVDRRTALFGPDHAATTIARTRLLLVMLSLGQDISGEVEELIGPVDKAASLSRTEVQALSNIGDGLRTNGQHQLALRVLRLTRDLARRHLAGEDALTLLVDHNFAAALGASGDLSGALQRYDELLPVLTSVLGPEHRLTLRARRQRAMLLARSGDTSTAFTEQVDLASAWSRLWGPASPEHAEALGDIAETCARAGLTERADHYRRLQEATGSAQDIALARRV